MSDAPRYWILDAMQDEDTSQHNRINEASEAIGFPVVGLVDEQGGGVIGYLHHDYANVIAESLNREDVATLAAAVNDANTLTPYLAIGLYPEPAPGQDFEGSGWELAGVFQADDARHGLEQAHDAEPEKVEWIVVPTEHVYRRAVE